MKSDKDFFIVNVHAPCESSDKQRSRHRLYVLVGNHVMTNICLCGDLNVFILSRKEEYCGLISRRMEIDIFNGFIEDNFLVDLSFHGRRFTWYLSDGQSMSRLYQFLLSKEWCLTWPNCV